MSWLFGYGKKSPETPDMSQFGVAPPEGPNASGGGPDVPNLTKSERKAMDAYRFDSSALERAAQAARELEKSSNFLLIFRMCVSFYNLFILCV